MRLKTAEHDHKHDGKNRQRIARRDRRIEQHADRNEKQDREGVLKGQGVRSRLVAEVRLAEDHPSEERSKRE